MRLPTRDLRLGSALRRAAKCSELVGGEAQSQSSVSNRQEVLLACDVCGKMMAEEAATINVGITCVAPVDAASCKH